MRRFFVISIFLSAVLTFSTLSARSEEEKLLPAPDIIPPATEEMQHPAFWISRIPDADRVIMAPEEIRAFNEKNRRRSLERTDINGDSVSLKRLAERPYRGLQYYREDPLTLESVPGDSLRDGIESNTSYIEGRVLYDRRWIPFTDAMKREISVSSSPETIPETVKPAYGVICRHTLNRRVPSHLAAYSSQYNWLDMFQTGSYETGRPVAVLHSSGNGDWSYVRSEFSYRWIPSECIALGKPDAARQYSEPEDFVVALDHRVPVYGDRDFNAWMTDIYQGARLPLVSTGGSAYEVLVPRRRTDGSLEAARGWIRPDAAVSVGYQAFTPANVIETMFRILGRPYGWGDSCHERDCCGIIRTTLDTFGIFTPRAPTHQFYYTDHAVTFPKELPKEEKFRLFDEYGEPGITICGFSGHIMLYLGKVGDDYFVIHSNGYSYHDAEGNEIKVARTSVTDLLLEGGSDIEQFTNISVYKP